MASRSVSSVCPYCGVGCGILLQVEDNRVVKVTGDKTHPTNRGRLCTKGTTCAQPLTESGRMDCAYVREVRSQTPVRADIQHAIRETARRLRGIIDTHGPDAVAFYVSGQMSLEAQYLASKLAKGFVRTAHIESNSRLCMASAGSGYKLSLGADGPPGSYDDFDQADVFFVIGANMADCHPILFLRMMDRVKAGAQLIVVDPRRTATADKADLFMHIKPGTDLALLNGLLYLLMENGHTDPAFIASFTEGWDALPAFLADYTPDKVAQITGIPEQDIRQAAHMIGTAKDWMSCWTMGLNQSTHGTWNTNALCNLHLATGAICRPGSGPFSLTGQPNAMGGREMGYMGPGLPGQRSALVAKDRQFIEALWGLPANTLRTESGRGTVAMFEGLRDGEIKACWIICTNPVASVPNRQTVIDGLRAAELVITQDAFLDTETNHYADILLPGALWAEGEGVMINSERNLTLTQQAADAPGDSLPDWQLIALVACEMGYAEAFTYGSAAEVFDEIKGAWNPATGYDIRGASHGRLRDGPLQWPITSESANARNPVRYLNDGVSQVLRVEPDGRRPAIIFPTASGKAAFLARPHVPPAEMPSEDFPFVLNTGRLQHQWHTLTKTGKVPTLNTLNPSPFIELNPEDAALFGIKDRDAVEVRSVRGRAVLPALVTDRVRPGNCFAPFHWNDVFGEHLAINAVTSDAVDPISFQPGFKYCAVALRRVELIAHRFFETAKAVELPVPAFGKTALTLLWASQTGNAEALAQRFGRRLRSAGIAIDVRAMDSFPAAQLAEVNNLILISSTFGDGESPDNGQAFWQSLSEREARLDRLNYAVLALGDPSYERFCQHGKHLEQRLESLGAASLLPRVDCDPEFDAPADAWFKALQQALGLDIPDSIADESAPSVALHTRSSPLLSGLSLNRRLNAHGAQKDTRQFALSLGDSGFRYEAGDALGVWPRNCPELVDEVLHHTGLDPDQTVILEKHGDVPLREALARHVEIARPHVDTLQFIAERSASPELKRLLDDTYKAALKDWLWGRQLADVLQAFPVQCSAEDLIGALKPMQPRSYSIASSAKAHPDEVHLTVSTVRYGKRKGVSSTFLADRAEQDQVPIFLQPSKHFRVPDDGEVPMIMIGPGTGVAPFRGFLQERQVRGDRGRNWLFFGEQHQATDFYYRDELQGMHSDGLLTRLSLAFSRDQGEKIYVQHRIEQQGAELWRWLQEGARLYVCGDATHMAKDVDVALRHAIALHGGMSEERAAEQLRQLAEQKRYVRDVY
ncbi:bifunctional nitrate reductase/sulfite reductase flavoprotein subunit alpha [Xanthomonas sp. WHRI 1810A]|uniref:bifunctional nitrate reductase/sulfite reductase flavoprotein subunit alpha n=1 Tax=Xanthomonas sp. WHRI 1810A TaxID=3161565 RepID=UPI0032E89063